MKDKKHMDEKNLDEMLNRLFLEEPEKMDEKSVLFIFQQEYDAKIDASKEKELLSKLGGKPNGSGIYLNLLIIALITVVSGIGFIFYTKFNTVKETETTEKINKVNENIAIQSSQGLDSPLVLLPLTEKKEPVTGRLHSERTDNIQNPKFSETTVSIYYPQSGVGSKTTPTFFKPSEQDFIFYDKAKKRMLEKLLTSDKEIYAVVEANQLKYKGNAINLTPFLIRHQTITNLEYKVFLAELLKNGRVDEFKTAIVRNEAWVNYGHMILASTYFFDEKYNDFPVVNISPKAAILFCHWLEKEVNQSLYQLNPQVVPLKIRLPFDTEYILAARERCIAMNDCDGYNTIYDIQEGILDKEELRRLELTKQRNQNKKTVLDDLFSVNRYPMNEDQILRLYEKGFAYAESLVTDSTYSGMIGIFGTAAHVSEIVIDQKTAETKIAGSCWKNKQQYTGMVKEFNKTDASPFIGFRVIVTTDKKENL